MSHNIEAERISQILFYGAILLLGWLGWQIVAPFIAEIAWAVIITVCLDPLRTRLERLGRTRAATLLTLGVVLLVMLPTVFITMLVVSEAQPAGNYLEAQMKEGGPAAGKLHAAWEWAHARARFLPSEEEATQAIAERMGAVAQFLSVQAGNLLKEALNFVFSFLITVALVFFFLRDADALAAMLRRALPFGAAQNQQLLSLSRDLVTASVTATLIVGAIQGAIGGITFALLGIEGAALWGALMGLFSVVPLVGTALVWAPAALWLALSGSPGKGIILALVGVLVIGMVDNIARPLFLSGKAQMHTLVLLISLMGGVSAFGFIGIVLGPLVAAILTALVESYQMALETPEMAPEAEGKK